MCPFCLVTSPSVQAALLIFHFLSTTSSLPLAVQTLNYSKDAEHSSSSPVSQIPLYNPQRNLLLCTRWIVFVAVFITGGGGALRFLSGGLYNTDCWSYGGTWNEVKKCPFFLVFFFNQNWVLRNTKSFQVLGKFPICWLSQLLFNVHWKHTCGSAVSTFLLSKSRFAEADMSHVSVLGSQFWRLLPVKD